jgi:hypothetical protein
MLPLGGKARSSGRLCSPDCQRKHVFAHIITTGQGLLAHTVHYSFGVTLRAEPCQREQQELSHAATKGLPYLGSIDFSLQQHHNIGPDDGLTLVFVFFPCQLCQVCMV